MYRKDVEDIAPLVLCESKIHAIFLRYISYMCLTYSTCGSHTILVHVLYEMI
jgi:hypothetical protein